MSTKTFKPGDRVVWWKQTPGGGYVVPVLSTVLAITAKRIKIEAEDEDEGGKVIRHVLPQSIDHHVSSAKSGPTPPAGASKHRSKRPKPTLQVAKKRSWPEKDEVREERIMMEIVVDAYNEDERTMGWYCYLESRLNAPFLARCIEEREVSPLNVGDEVQVVGMSAERECQGEMFVSIRWGKRKLAVPLAQLEVTEADDQTREAVEDWHYWVGMGYQF